MECCCVEWGVVEDVVEWLVLLNGLCGVECC